MATTAAFFDLDGTLCTGHIWKGLSSYCRDNSVNLGIYYPFFFGHMLLWALYKAKLVPEKTFVYRWGKDMAVLTRGLSEEQARSMFKWTFETEIVGTLRPDILSELTEHLSQGHKVFLVSGAFQDILDMIATEVGADYALGTTLQVRRRRYTGDINEAFCFGQDKADQLRQYMESLKLDMDMASSYAYADRYYDLPMLEMVGNPVAVYPDARLKTHAKHNNWRIIEGAPSEVKQK